MKMTFKDYDASKIAIKLKQVEDFEAKYGENNTSRGWKKWCIDINYRKREWQWRQNLAKANEELNKNGIFPI